VQLNKPKLAQSEILKKRIFTWNMIENLEMMEIFEIKLYVMLTLETNLIIFCDADPSQKPYYFNQVSDGSRLGGGLQ
jgi:hypothetical protein